MAHQLGREIGSADGFDDDVRQRAQRVLGIAGEDRFLFVSLGVPDQDRTYLEQLRL